MQRLEAEASVVPPIRPAELDAEVSQLKAKLAMMEAEQARLREGAARAPRSERCPTKHPVLEEFLPCLIMPRKWSNG